MDLTAGLLDKVSSRLNGLGRANMITRNTGGMKETGPEGTGERPANAVVRAAASSAGQDQSYMFTARDLRTKIMDWNADQRSYYFGELVRLAHREAEEGKTEAMDVLYGAISDSRYEEIRRGSCIALGELLPILADKEPRYAIGKAMELALKVDEPDEILQKQLGSEAQKPLWEEAKAGILALCRMQEPECKANTMATARLDEVVDSLETTLRIHTRRIPGVVTIKEVAVRKLALLAMIVRESPSDLTAGGAADVTQRMSVYANAFDHADADGVAWIILRTEMLRSTFENERTNAFDELAAWDVRSGVLMQERYNALIFAGKSKYSDLRERANRYFEKEAAELSAAGFDFGFGF